MGLVYNMSDEDRDVDIESDDEFDEDDDGSTGGHSSTGASSIASTQFMTQAEKRAHHNALERKRRDHIKESFHSLRDSVPSLQGEKISRAQILKKAADYIQLMRKKNTGHQQDIDDLRRQNDILEHQIRALEKAKTTGQFAAQSSALNQKGGAISAFDGGSGSESSEIDETETRRKKIKLT